MLRGQSHRNATRKANVYASQALRELNVMIAYQALREINAKNVLKIILDIQIVKVNTGSSRKVYLAFNPKQITPSL